MSRSRTARWTVMLVFGVGVGYGLTLWLQQQAQHDRQQLQDSFTKAAAAQDWTQAQQQAQLWTQQYPDDPGSWFALAEVATQQQEYADAAEALSHVPADSPQSEKALEQRLELCFTKLDQPLQGLKISQQLLQQRPAHGMAHHFRSLFYAVTLQRPQLAAAARQAIQDRGDSPQHYAWLMMLDDLRIRNGPSLTEQWLRQEPDNEAIRCAHAIHSVRHARDAAMVDTSPENQRLLQEALARRQQVQEQYPENCDLLHTLLIEAMNDGDVSRTADLLTRASRHCEPSHLLWRARGWFHLQRSEYTEAEQSLQEALQLHPLSWASRSLLADVQRLSGQAAAGEQQLQLAATGVTIYDSLEDQARFADISEATWRQLTDYATRCEDWIVANGLHRRLLPTQ